jgi:hypothetical protein
METITDEFPGAVERGLTIEIAHDEDCENPRGYGEPASRLWFYKRAGGLSDEAAGDEFSFGFEDFRDVSGLIAAMKKAAPGIEILPVYKYDHSGVRYNTTGFSCPWDSGLAGLIYVTAPAMRTWFGVQRLQNTHRVEMREVLRSEIAVYGAWANGECYYVRIIGPDGETIDAQGGFIGRERAIEETAGMIPLYPLVDAGEKGGAQ